MKLLSDKAVIHIKATGRYEKCEAYLLANKGGKTVVYIQDGVEIFRESFKRSQFKNLDLTTLED